MPETYTTDLIFAIDAEDDTRRLGVAVHDKNHYPIEIFYFDEHDVRA